MATEEEEDRLCFLRSVSLCCSIAKPRLVLLDSLADSDFKTVGDGIVFIHAPWSGQAVRALAAISKILNQGKFNSLRLFIVNIDSVYLGRETYGNIRFAGYGETFWVKGGQLAKIGSNYDDNDSDELTTITDALVHDQ